MEYTSANASPVPSTGEESVQLLLNNLNQRLESLESKPLTTGGATPKVALPDKFDGSSSKCRRFITSVENIFALQSARYSTSEIRTRFIGTLLSGDALTWFSGVVD